MDIGMGAMRVEMSGMRLEHPWLLVRERTSRVEVGFWNTQPPGVIATHLEK